MPTKILLCTCDDRYQDERYGRRKRVHNQKKNQEPQKWECTVCGDVKVR